ncbi:MAG TPA: M28 family metallopeptidase [Candidatus Acidoferrales bacterium]|nr:M28 family metallopeptidase [Candidatus Acidoferrales bacterium]
MKRHISPEWEARLHRSDRRRYRGLLAALILVTPLGISAFANSGDTNSMAGFSVRGAAEEVSVEQQLRSLTSTDQISKFHRYLTSEPHPAGSARNNELAQWVAEQWRQQGLEDVTIHEYDVLNSSPREISLEMVHPGHYRASLREDPYDVDPDTKNPKADGAYLGYSASGEVTAPVVYAHSGNPEDYDYLRAHGIDVRGKIVLVRYSNPYSYRGFKALTAERLGAAAMLIYSDPQEDGYKQGKVFPEGPWGPESHIQRGAITYDFLEPGDPLTPGWASVPGAKRIPIEQAISLPKIMGVPLSWRDAKPLLEKMDGPVAPESWQGGLPLKYRLGGKRVQVHLKVDMDTRVQPYYVTEARIRGSEAPDEWVILGNHRDAWVYGAVDPSSGTASMLELTRNLGELLRQGIRPKRTLVICSWDGEEYALTGSTEWGEEFADELKQKAVAYLNVDEATSGNNFQGDAVGSLAPMLVEVSHTLPAPSGKSLYDEWKVSRQAEMNDKQGLTDFELANTRIGSGSDHTVFLNFLGIPVVGLTFVGPYGVYHSLYDDFYWMNHFGDPGYRYHSLMTQLWGTVALRLANAEILPFDFESYGRHIHKFVSELDDSSHIAGHIDLASLERRIAEFQQAGREVNQSVVRAIESGSLNGANARGVNEELMHVERNWCNPEGIPGRPWFKHSLYAARYTYAHLELPGLTEAAEAGDWKQAVTQAKILEDELTRNTALLQHAKSELDSLAGTGTP